MNETEAMMKLYENMAKTEADNSKRWHKQLIISNIIWAVVVVCLVIAHFVYESQFETQETIERSTITQENNEGNNVYQPGEYATYNEGGD